MGDTQANQRKKTRGEDYIAQGSILAVAVVITKIIGVDLPVRSAQGAPHWGAAP